MPFVRFLRTPHEAEAGPGHGFREGGVYEVSGRSLAYWRGIIPEAVEEVPSLPVAVTQAAAEQDAPPGVPPGPPDFVEQHEPPEPPPEMPLFEAPEEAPEEAPSDERAMLLAEAERRGITVDGRWGILRLRAALAAPE